MYYLLFHPSLSICTNKSQPLLISMAMPFVSGAVLLSDDPAGGGVKRSHGLYRFLSGTDGAVSTEPNLFELCRVATEEDHWSRLF